MTESNAIAKGNYPEIWDRGYAHGQGCVGHETDEAIKEALKELGYPFPVWRDARDTVLEKISEYAHASADNSRQYSPWEYECAEINNYAYSLGEGCHQEVWEAYEEGTAQAIAEDIEADISDYAYDYEEAISEIETVYDLLVHMCPYMEQTALEIKDVPGYSNIQRFNINLFVAVTGKRVCFEYTDINGDEVLTLVAKANAAQPEKINMQTRVGDNPKPWLGGLVVAVQNWLGSTLPNKRSIKDGDTVHELPYYQGASISHDDTVWIHRNEYGSSSAYLAASFEGAFEELLDNDPGIDKEDIPDAYGFDTLAELEAADLDRVSLVEGYYYMPNFGDTTGIVNLGHHWTLTEVKKNN